MGFDRSQSTYRYWDFSRVDEYFRLGAQKVDASRTKLKEIGALEVESLGSVAASIEVDRSE